MRDYYMILVIIVLFAGGYLGAGYLDVLMRKSRRQRVAVQRPRYQWMNVGVENIDMLNGISETLESSSDYTPYLEILVNHENKEQIFRDLKEERLDVALLADEPEEKLPDEYQTIRIPHIVHPVAAKNDRVINPPEIDTNIVLIWNTHLDNSNMEYFKNIVQMNEKK